MHEQTGFLIFKIRNNCFSYFLISSVNLDWVDVWGGNKAMGLLYLTLITNWDDLVM